MTLSKAPTVRDLSAFTKSIRECQDEKVESMIWNNPKILVTEVDTPILLHEGCRYNALHIAARSGNSNAVKIILKAVGSKKLMDILYPDDDTDNKNRRSIYLTDLYLNAPDAILHETPLHFACKFGFPNVCEVLILHPQIKLDPRNKDGESPVDVLCTRLKDSEKKTKGKISAEIRRMFHALLIVPIWRDADGFHGTVGEPIKLTDVDTDSWIPKPPKETFENESIRHHPKTIISNGKSKKVAAFVGPMTSDEAKTFTNSTHKSATTRLAPSPARSPVKQSPNTSLDRMTEVFARLTLDDSGGVSMTKKTLDTNPIEESSPVVVVKTEKSESESLVVQSTTTTEPFSIKDMVGDTLENIMEKFKKIDRQFNSCQPSGVDILRGGAKLTMSPRFQPNRESVRDAIRRLEDPFKGLERATYLKAKEENLKWHEYWNFLDKYVDVTSHPGMEFVDQHLAKVEKDIIIRSGADAAQQTKNSCDSVPDNEELNKSCSNTQFSFSTGTSSDDCTDTFEDCETLDVYVNGGFVTVDDWFLQQAIQDALENIPPEERAEKYPHLSCWFAKLKSFGCAYRKGWAAATPKTIYVEKFTLE